MSASEVDPSRNPLHDPDSGLYHGDIVPGSDEDPTAPQNRQEHPGQEAVTVQPMETQEHADEVHGTEGSSMAPDANPMAPATPDSPSQPTEEFEGDSLPDTHTSTTEAPEGQPEADNAALAAELDGMTKDQLLAFAKDHGVSPANASMSKDEIRASIDAALAEA